ncbi:sensor histidine kinase [Pseudomonas sp. SH10-3B]|nr:sensor histidine kinase [Pseudomonas sp. SH10-3B]
MVFDVNDTQYPLTTDAGAINIALTNLVTNAANFSPEHGVITVSLGKTAKGLVLSVDDQGPGIDESQRERLFERFYSRGNAQGAGLGLTIVQAIAQRLGGQVRLDNLAAGGLRASLEIPQ